MDPAAEQLQEALTDIELAAEQVLLTRREMVECDRSRNSNREALSAMRRLAKTSRSSLPAPVKPKRALVTVLGAEETPRPSEDVGSSSCLTCGDHDGTSPIWMMSRTADVFVRLPFHTTHTLLQQEEERLERRSRSLQSTLKEETMALSEKGGLSDRIPTGLLNAFVNLKDNR